MDNDKIKIIFVIIISISILIFSYTLSYKLYNLSTLLIILHIIAIPVLNTLINQKHQQIDNIFEEKYKEFERKLKKHV
jgi:hypothetical protein